MTAIVTASLLMVRFLDHPYENQSGSIKPVEMTRSLDRIEQKQEATGQTAEPCDEPADHGRPSVAWSGPASIR